MRAPLLLALVALPLVAAVAAQASRGSDAEAFAQALKEARQAEARSTALDQRARRATDAAARARVEGAALAARIEAAESDLTAAQRRIVMVERLQATQRARLAVRQQPLVRLTAALQTMARRPAALALVQPGSVDDTVRVRSLLAATLPEIRRRTAALRAEVSRGNALRRDADLARTALLASREQLRRRRVELAAFEARERARSTELAGLALTESDRALALGEEARVLARTIGNRAYQAQLEASLAQLPEPMPRPLREGQRAAQRANPLPYLLPVQGRLLTGVGEISDGGVHSRGLTFVVAPGAEVIAPANGRVLFAAAFRSYGNVVILDHGRGWSTVITNLATLDVAPGAIVRRGATLGRTGGVAPNVTVELRRNGRPVPVAQLLAG